MVRMLAVLSVLAGCAAHGDEAPPEPLPRTLETLDEAQILEIVESQHGDRCIGEVITRRRRIGWEASCEIASETIGDTVARKALVLSLHSQTGEVLQETFRDPSEVPGMRY